MDQNTRAYYMNLAREAARRYGVPEDLFISLIQQESGFNPTAESPKGAYGLTQLMPDTAAELGVNPRNIEENLAGGARYLNQMMTRFPDLNMALAAYNAGPTLVSELGRVPNYRETQNYIKNILGRLPDGRPRNMPLQAQMTERDVNTSPFNPNNLMDYLKRRDNITGLNEFQRFAAALDPLIHPEMRAGDSIRQQGAQRAKTMQGNRTADMLDKMPNGKMYADAIRNGADASTVYMQYMKDQRAGVINPKDLTKMRGDLRKEFTGLGQVKDFGNIVAAYTRIQKSVEEPSAAGDLSLIFNYMKMLDPQSVVREGEFAAAAAAGGYGERIAAMVQKLKDGTLLTASQRADFVDRATRLYKGAEGTFDERRAEYEGFAERAGLPTDIFPDYRYKGELPQRPTILMVPPRPDSSQFPTDEDWIKFWQEQTEEWRRQYLEADD